MMPFRIRSSNEEDMPHFIFHLPLIDVPAGQSVPPLHVDQRNADMRRFIHTCCQRLGHAEDRVGSSLASGMTEEGNSSQNNCEQRGAKVVHCLVDYDMKEVPEKEPKLFKSIFLSPLDELTYRVHYAGSRLKTDKVVHFGDGKDRDAFLSATSKLPANFSVNFEVRKSGLGTAEKPLIVPFLFFKKSVAGGRGWCDPHDFAPPKTTPQESQREEGVSAQTSTRKRGRPPAEATPSSLTDEPEPIAIAQAVRRSVAQWDEMQLNSCRLLGLFRERKGCVCLRHAAVCATAANARANNIDSTPGAEAFLPGKVNPTFLQTFGRWLSPFTLMEPHAVQLTRLETLQSFFCCCLPNFSLATEFLHRYLECFEAPFCDGWFDMNAGTDAEIAVLDDDSLSHQNDEKAFIKNIFSSPVSGPCLSYRYFFETMMILDHNQPSLQQSNPEEESIAGTQQDGGAVNNCSSPSLEVMRDVQAKYGLENESTVQETPTKSKNVNVKENKEETSSAPASVMQQSMALLGVDPSVLINSLISAKEKPRAGPPRRGTGASNVPVMIPQHERQRLEEVIEAMKAAGLVPASPTEQPEKKKDGADERSSIPSAATMRTAEQTKTSSGRYFSLMSTFARNLDPFMAGPPSRHPVRQNSAANDTLRSWSMMQSMRAATAFQCRDFLLGEVIPNFVHALE